MFPTYNWDQSRRKGAMNRQENMRVMVTGGCGFIGSALVRTLVEDGVEVLNVDAMTYAAVPGALNYVEQSDCYQHAQLRIEDTSAIRRIMDDFQPDAVFHLAAETHVDRSIDDPGVFVQTNIVGTASLLRASSDYAGTEVSDFRFIHVSTDEVFGSADSGPFTPDSPHRPNSPYAASKSGSDQLVRAWHHTYALPTIITNCSNNYGPWQFPEKLIPRMITRALQGLSMPLYGDGKHERDWIHVTDHVRGLRVALERGVPGSTYLFGSAIATSNVEIVRGIASALDRIVPSGAPHDQLIEYVEDRPGHDRRYQVDISGTSAKLGWTPTVDLESGLHSTVLWYVEHEPWWRSIIENRYNTERLGLS